MFRRAANRYSGLPADELRASSSAILVNPRAAVRGWLSSLAVVAIIHNRFITLAKTCERQSGRVADFPDAFSARRCSIGRTASHDRKHAFQPPRCRYRNQHAPGKRNIFATAQRGHQIRMLANPAIRGRRPRAGGHLPPRMPTRSDLSMRPRKMRPHRWNPE